MGEVIFWTSLLIYGIVALIDLRWAVYLLFALLPTFLLRTQLFGIPTTWLELAIYLAVVIFVACKLKQKKLKQTLVSFYQNYKYPIVAMLLWLGAALLATITSPNLARSAGALKGWWIDPILLISITVMLTKTNRHLQQLIFALLVGAALISVYGLGEIVLGVGLRSDKLLNSVFVSANYVAMLIVPITILGFGYFLSLSQGKQKTAIALLLGLNLTALILTQSIGGFLGMALGVLTLILFIPQTKKRHQAIKIYLLLSFLAAALLFTTPKIQRLIYSPETSSLATRSQIWQTAITLIKEHPLKGIGLGNFENPYRQTVARLFKAPLEWEVVKAHNLYLNLWLEIGLWGVICFFVLIFYFGKGLKKALTNTNPSSKIWWQLAGSSAALVSILTHGLVDTPYFKNDLSIVFLLIFIMPFIVANLSPILTKSDKNDII